MVYLLFMAIELLDSKKELNNDKNFSNFEAEIALIGCILWDNRNYEKIASRMKIIC